MTTDAALLALHVADDPAAWERLGFTVEQGRVRIGTTDLVIEPADGARGITGWTLALPGAPASVEGLDTATGDAAHGAGLGPAHANGSTAIDHLVVSTPDLERTIATFEGLGLECRRRRDGAAYGSQKMRQAFFWLGDGAGKVILELVGPAEPDPTKADAPAAFFGLALVSQDLDATCAFYGDLMKPPTEAVQAGRRITTLSSRAGCGVALAFMSGHV